MPLDSQSRCGECPSAARSLRNHRGSRILDLVLMLAQLLVSAWEDTVELRN